ncbi:hypothetical protein AGLY_008714 [Aphis glycines]|uniref:Uncharacterized protein n=1 Tax=Aphis glycines TaxID=307491 RepID=A0A6G0TJY7_APHGL|nr:hypothetical protein AGLY_008714 [Aphis glycines]
MLRFSLLKDNFKEEIELSLYLKEIRMIICGLWVLGRLTAVMYNRWKPSIIDNKKKVHTEILCMPECIPMSAHFIKSFVEAIKNTRQQWTGHAWRNQNPLNLYSPGKEPYRKNTHRKTKNDMGRCSEGRGRTRRRNIQKHKISSPACKLLCFKFTITHSIISTGIVLSNVLSVSSLLISFSISSNIKSEHSPTFISLNVLTIQLGKNDLCLSSSSAT